MFTDNVMKTQDLCFKDKNGVLASDQSPFSTSSITCWVQSGNEYIFFVLLANLSWWMIGDREWLLVSTYPPTQIGKHHEEGACMTWPYPVHDRRSRSTIKGQTLQDHFL